MRGALRTNALWSCIFFRDLFDRLADCFQRLGQPVATSDAKIHGVLLAAIEERPQQIR